ncbi:MAG: hypothetical protein Q4B10_05135 [Actinomycetaceae bacterium]|nr:hypothetical protein [Actinomycetaceae bacterium]
MKAIKITLVVAGLTALAIGACPPARARVTSFASDFASAFAEHEARLRSALVPDTVPLNL